MTIMVMDNASPGLRGELTRWLLELKAGVFAGNISALVREKLWEKVKSEIGCGSALMLYSANNEQGFIIEMHNAPGRSVVEMDGLYLIKRTVDS